MSEATIGVNLNPSGTPYNGSSNSTQLDLYPSRIEGLVHATGGIDVSSDAWVKGVIICDGSGSKLINVTANQWTVGYNSTLYANPPQFYTSSVNMLRLAGSVKQVVN